VTPAPSRVEGRLLLATTNRDKLREIHRVLRGMPLELLTLADLPPIDEPDETGATFAENARLKALHYANAAARHLDDPSLLIVAEDSGLVVDALDGEPGVRSARFLRPDASYQERFDEIYRRLLRPGGRARHGRGLRNQRERGGRDQRRATRQQWFRIRPDILLPALRPDAGGSGR
jgi:XTP/dITP diphosphohydrolase